MAHSTLTSCEMFLGFWETVRACSEVNWELHIPCSSMLYFTNLLLTSYKCIFIFHFLLLIHFMWIVYQPSLSYPCHSELIFSIFLACKVLLHSSICVTFIPAPSVCILYSCKSNFVQNISRRY